MILLSLANYMANIERENATEIIRVLLEASRNTAVMNDHPQDVETAAKTLMRHIPDGRAEMKDRNGIGRCRPVSTIRCWAPGSASSAVRLTGRALRLPGGWDARRGLV